MENERWTFSRTEFVLVLKISEQEPLSLSLSNLLVGVEFENGASWASELIGTLSIDDEDVNENVRKQ